ncbi:hypothetical protein SAMN05518849_10191 [Sphingobium sp. AP50]|nr:hypothetical protein SAMN05518849_10191 [Sphingobium sp. AP50]
MRDLSAPRTTLYDVRNQLRMRLRPLERERPLYASAQEETVEDADMLALLEHVRLEYAADEADSRRRYATACAGSTALTFDDLIRDGWFQVLFGRVVTPLTVSVASSRAPTLSPVLRPLLGDRFGIAKDFSKVPPISQALAALIGAIEAGERDIEKLECRTPAWVAARLWENRPDVSDPLRWWLDRWALLHHVPLAPFEVWEASVAQHFTNLVLDRLETEPALIPWCDIPLATANQMMRASAREEAATLERIPHLPSTLIGRARWLGDPVLGELPRMRTDAFEEARNLVFLISADIERRQHGMVPDPHFARLVDLAIERPDLLGAILERTQLYPLAIADLLARPATCALGIWLLSVRTAGPAWAGEDETAAQFAIPALEDGLALLLRFLKADETGALALEAASLLAAVYDTDGRPRRLATANATATMVLNTLQALEGAAAPIAAALAATAQLETLDAPIFLAALDLIAAAGLVEAVDPDPLPALFAATVRKGHHQLSANRLSEAAASTLVRLARRCGRPSFSRFFYPIDWRDKLEGVADTDLETQWQVGRSIEAVTRTFARAAASEAGDAPDDLIIALADHVRAGSEDDLTALRVSAFRPRFSALPWAHPAEISIGTLLGTALSALHRDDREELLAACLELRDPALLADLHQTAPEEDRKRIEERIEALPPDQAIPTYSITALHLRIDALLDAGLLGPAELLMESAKDATTMGAARDRARTELAHRLRLSFRKGDWAAIAAAQIPDALPPDERVLCERILDSFRGLALLRQEGGDPEAAVAIFERLVRDNPGEAGYQVNLFAARAVALLGNDAFPQCARAEQRPARQLMGEIEQWMAGADEKDRDTCSANLAVLDLAVGDAGRALSRLLALPEKSDSASRAANLAIGYGRLGRVKEAHLALTRAIDKFGTSPLIDAARAHLVGEPSTGGLGAASQALFALDVEDLHRLRAAMTSFGRRSANDKASILRDGDNALAALVTEDFDSVLSAVSNLAPLLNSGVIGDNEDDITAIVKQLLNARFAHLGWSVPDQTKGGYTAAFNYGERDLVLVDGLTTLAVIEAIVQSNGVGKENLTHHFRKMLGYEDCALYYHLTYAWFSDFTRLMTVLKEIAREEAPDGYHLEALDEVLRVGNGPRGLNVRYRVDGRPINVFFRVLDLGQQRLRDSATASATKPNKPSRASRKNKTQA